jgi:hypothetical protein
LWLTRPYLYQRVRLLDRLSMSKEILIKNFEPVQIKCDSAGNFFFNYSYGVLPKPPLSTDSAVYKTNIAGIGIKFNVNSTVKIPYTSTSISGCTNSTTCVPPQPGIILSSLRLSKPPAQFLPV